MQAELVDVKDAYREALENSNLHKRKALELETDTIPKQKAEIAELKHMVELLSKDIQGYKAKLEQKDITLMTATTAAALVVASEKQRGDESQVNLANTLKATQALGVAAFSANCAVAQSNSNYPSNQPWKSSDSNEGWKKMRVGNPTAGQIPMMVGKTTLGRRANGTRTQAKTKANRIADSPSRSHTFGII